MLLGKLVAAQSSLERTIADLARSGVSTAAADGQFARLAGLQASIGLADAATLQLLTGQIGAALAQARGIEQQARDQIASANATEREATLGQAATATRSALREAMDSLRNIPLHFSSTEDERAYRDREAERQAYITAQQARHTPQGDLNAAGAGVGQMVDAKAHGASGPEFDQKWQALVSTTERLRAEAKASGLSTEEFDQRLRDDLRRVLKAKGLSDAQIDAQFAAHPDPLEAARAYLKDGADVEAVKEKIGNLQARGSEIASGTTPSAKSSVADYIAALKATGVVAADAPKGVDPHHGVALAVANVDGGRTV